MKVTHTILPANFAQRVLELEASAASHMDHSLLNELLGLYSQAIEYYESRKNKKFAHYLSRMRGFMSKPEVLALLNQPVSQKMQKTQSSASISLAADRLAQKAIKTHSRKSSSTFEKVKDSLNVQDQNLKVRVQARAKTRCGSLSGSDQSVGRLSLIHI